MTCPCACHRDVVACDFMVKLGGCRDRPGTQPAPRTQPAHDLAPVPVEPTSRCVIDRRRSRRDGGMTCWHCHDALRDMLDPTNHGDDDARLPASIPVLFARLNPRPATGDATRRAPGFGAVAPISAQAVALRDRRSKATTTVHEPGLPPGVWTDRDGVIYEEQRAGVGSGPPLHATVVLHGWARVLADERNVDVPRVPDTRPRDGDYIGPMTFLEHDLTTLPVPPDTSVTALAAMLQRHLDWLTRQPWIDELHAELTTLRDQLRPATGDPRPRPVGRCPNTLDDGPRTRECRALLRVPLWSDTVQCGACGRTWTRAEWLRLGELMQARGNSA